MRIIEDTIEIDGESYGFSPPAPGSIEGIPSDTPVDPEGWRYYSDVLDGPTVAWIIAYAKEHPEDEFIQGRVHDFQEMNRDFRKRTGRNMPGYDTTFFAEDIRLSEGNA
jgi:hypothetical protein